jgi:hypothetical protein
VALTPFGFFSIVQKPNTTNLTIRSRARRDLDSLRSKYLPRLSPTLADVGTDYRYRARAGHQALADAFARIARDISYNNFKKLVATRMGRQRAEVYHAGEEKDCHVGIGKTRNYAQRTARSKSGFFCKHQGQLLAPTTSLSRWGLGAETGTPCICALGGSKCTASPFIAGDWRRGRHRGANKAGLR